MVNRHSVVFAGASLVCCGNAKPMTIRRMRASKKFHVSSPNAISSQPVSLIDYFFAVERPPPLFLQFCLTRERWLTTIGDHAEEEEEEAAAAEAIPTIGKGDTEVCTLRHEWTIDGSDEAAEDDYDDRRPQRRRYEEPIAVTVRKQVLSIAESVGSSLFLLTNTELMCP